MSAKRFVLLAGLCVLTWTQGGGAQGIAKKNRANSKMTKLAEQVIDPDDEKEDLAKNITYHRSDFPRHGGPVITSRSDFLSFINGCSALRPFISVPASAPVPIQSATPPGVDVRWSCPTDSASSIHTSMFYIKGGHVADVYYGYGATAFIVREPLRVSSAVLNAVASWTVTVVTCVTPATVGVRHRSMSANGGFETGSYGLSACGSSGRVHGSARWQDKYLALGHSC